MSLVHTHSEYSWDSQLRSLEAAKRVADLGHKFYVLTDHGTMSGLVEHEKACKKAGVKPGLGCEVYYQNDYDESKPRTHLTLIARDNQGLKNLYLMQSEAARHFYHVPVVTGEVLEKFSKGLIILSGCLSSYSSRLILEDNFTEWQLFIEGLNSIADKGCFFLELQPFSVIDSDGVDLQKKVNEALLHYHALYGLPIVLTGDSHFVNKKDIDTYMLALRVARDKADSMGDYTDRYLQSTQDMFEAWEQMFNQDGLSETSLKIFNQAIKNTDVIGDMCDATTFKSPQLPVLGFNNSRQELVDRVVAGLKQKNLWIDAYKSRANYELTRIIHKNFCDYILMVHNEFLWFKQENIPATIRGSAAGSLVCYALDFTKGDPLKLVDTDGSNAGFDRFLGEDRTDLPDIDIDIAANLRDMAVNHFREKYAGKTAPVSNFGRWQAKTLVNKLESLGFIEKVDALALKNILTELKADVVGMSDKIFAHPVLVKLEEKYPGLCNLLLFMHNTVSYTGTHASAVAITREPIDTQLALLSVAKNGGPRVLQTCYHKDDLEFIGGVKVDFLGNSGLQAIQIAEKAAGITFEESWLADEAMLQGFIDGDTAGINQFEKKDATNMIKQVARALHGLTFSDLVAVNAINRPGAAPLEKYIQGSTDSIVAPFCQDSRGALIYQEQVMKLLRAAGMSWEEVGQFLKANKRKIKVPELRVSFVVGMKRYGHDVKDLHKVFDGLEGLYLFNKSHAESYTLMSCEEMYLKNGNRPKDKKGNFTRNGAYTFSWFLGLLSSEGNLEKRRIYTADAVQHGVYVVPPHINGGARYRKIFVQQKGEAKPYIQEGLLHIDGIGETTAYAIEHERLDNGDYASEQDFVDRLTAKSKIKKSNGDKFKNPASKGTLETLRKYGCLEFDPEKKAKQIIEYNRTKMRQVVYIS